MVQSQFVFELENVLGIMLSQSQRKIVVLWYTYMTKSLCDAENCIITANKLENRSRGKKIRNEMSWKQMTRIKYQSDITFICVWWINKSHEMKRNKIRLKVIGGKKKQIKMENVINQTQMKWNICRALLKHCIRIIFSFFFLSS